MKQEWILLASSGTLEGILGSVKRFFGGEEKPFDGEKLYRQNGEVMNDFRIVQKRGRYRFEMVK
jgi:hypothetical protein